MSAFIWGGLALLAGLLWAETREWLPSLAQRLIRKAVQHLPESSRDRMLEELSAEVASVPGKISPMLFACSLWWSLSCTSLMASFGRSFSRPLIRCCDVAGSLVALVMYWWLFPILAVAVRLASGGRILERTPKLGIGGTPFDELTFKVDAATGFGSFLRRTSLVDIPLLLNVARGDLSFVGPPSLDPSLPVDRVLDVRPGMVWVDLLPHESGNGYGGSVRATASLYFRVLGAGLLSLFLVKTEHRKR